MVERQFVIVVGVSAESLDDLGRLFPRATIVCTPTLEEATRWMEGAAGAAPVHPSALTVGGLSIDVDGHVVSCGDVQLDRPSGRSGSLHASPLNRNARGASRSCSSARGGSDTC